MRRLYATVSGNLIVLACFGLVMLMLGAFEVVTPGRELALRGPG